MSRYVLILVLTVGIAGCGVFQPKCTRLHVTVPEDYAGLFVVIQSNDTEEQPDEVRVTVSPDGGCSFSSSRNVVELGTVKFSAGRRLRSIDDLGSNEVGYKWIGTTSKGEHWFFVGTPHEYRQVRTGVHRVAGREFRF